MQNVLLQLLSIKVRKGGYYEAYQVFLEEGNRSGHFSIASHCRSFGRERCTLA